MSLQIIPSLDGSHTLFSEALGVTYHSHHGAIQESSVVFIDSGLNYLLEQGAKNIKIFELGFGTGLNCLNVYL
jgi:tRNA U34 5-methylaminomethyl-2-thiouridine-forming methyltransferase MnmC